MTTLYHYTSAYHLKFIMAHGRLMTTDSDFAREQFAAPMCVWCTTDPDPAGKHGLRGGGCAVDKTEVRFTLKIPDELVCEWSGWAIENGMDALWRLSLTEAAGGERVADTWRLVFESVPSSMWVAVENMKTGETYDLALAGYDANEEYSTFVEREFGSAVTAIQECLKSGAIPAMAEGDVCQMLSAYAAESGAVASSDASDMLAWLSRSKIPLGFLNAVYAGDPSVFRMARKQDGTNVVACANNVPQMNRAQRRAAAKSRR